MPLVRFEVKNEYGLGDPELYRGASKRDDPKALLDGTAVAGLVGILRQLGDLAEFAADIFHDLHEQVMATATRGHKMLSRIQHIEEALPSLENAIQGQTSHIHFAYVAGTDWHAKLRTEKSLLLSSDLPRFMLDSYEECRDPPRLYLLDKFDSGGTGACLKRYSDPSYFKRVWTTSDLAKAEMVQREKKAQTNKRKGSRLRNGENQNAGYMSRRNSSTHFASPMSEVQSFSTENISISDLRLKSELASGSTSFGSKTRLSFVEQVSDTNPSVVPDEEEYDKLSVTKLQIDHSDSCPSALHGEPNGDVADDDSHHYSLQGSGPRSPSVTWDEKTEIVKSTSSKSCEDILVDRILESEPLPATSESPNMDTETSKHGSRDREDILLDNSNPSLSLSAGNHFDEVTSEADNYMDALNTLESETETDSECQTKREVKSLSNIEYQGMESTTRQMHGTTAVNFDSSDIVTPMASHCPLNNDVSPVSYNLGSSESSEMAQSPLTTGFVPAGNGFSKNVPDTSRTIDFEGSPELSIPDSQTMSVDETTSNTSKSLDFPFDTSGIPSTQLWTNGGLFGVQPSKPIDFSVPNIANESLMSGSKNTGCDLSSENVTTKLHCGASSTKSKTVVNPNETISNNSSNVENINGSPNTLSSVDQSSLNNEQLFGLICSVAQPTDPSKCFPSCHDYKCNDMPVKHNSQESVEALSLDQLEKTQGMPSDIIYAHTTRADQKKTNIAPGTELPCQIESKSNESGQSTKAISSSFSGLAQRFLANSLQRNALITHADISTPSGVMNADIRTSQVTSIQNKHKKSGTSDGQNTKEQIDQGSFRKPISFSSRYSESSSPPLEHMKISFHPMNGLETSKLKLEFPNGNLHENIEDMMFPSFKLLPGPHLPLPDSGSESDDDTFCRSCPYSSEDILSPRSYSNSEQWEKDERSGSKENEIYNDSCRISSSSTSNCSCIGFELRNHCNIDSASGFENFETKDGTITFQSGSVVDLPGFDSFISSKSQWEEQCDSSSSEHANSALQSPNELPPPPPPLPPMQWRVMKSSFTSTEEEDSRTAEIVDHLDDLQAQIFNVALQQEQAVPKPPCSSGNLASNSIKHTQDQQKLNGNREPNHDVNRKKMDEREELVHQIRNMHDQKKLNGLQHDQKKLNGHKEPKKIVNIEVDEREELLHQIRNKAFNLRRTAAAKPSLTPQPTTNVNVAAILEKANAIRQAFVGSDEGGDDDDGDNWSED